MDETPAEKRKRIEKRDLNRGTVCVGCHYNYYNWPKGASPNGDVAIPDDYSCWYIGRIAHGKCALRPPY